ESGHSGTARSLCRNPTRPEYRYRASSSIKSLLESFPGPKIERHRSPEHRREHVPGEPASIYMMVRFDSSAVRERAPESHSSDQFAALLHEGGARKRIHYRLFGNRERTICEGIRRLAEG